MTYLTFHLVFILPPILLLAIAYRKRLSAGNVQPFGRWIALLCAIAFVYTTPWDNYLVANEIWWYSADRVIGTIGYVPIEEYAFFLLQPILAGLWLALLPARSTPKEAGRLAPRVAGGLASLVVAAAGVIMLGFDQTLYLGLILAWAMPVVAGQWALQGDLFLRHQTRLVIGVLVPTLYLWIADRVAIGQEIWIISPTYTTGFNLFGLPIEEAAFFLVTNLMVVQGLLMFTAGRDFGVGVRVRRHQQTARSAM